MHQLLEKLAASYPELSFVAASSFYWCPETKEVYYDAFKEYQETSDWSLLHETSHALLGHTSYKADLELLQLEVSAWNHARTLAKQYGVAIDQDYIQDCLDTYRDWLYRRSLCPGCGAQCIQLDQSSYYRCFNCHTRWHVSPSRFCRPYRRAQAKRREYSTAFALRMIGH